MTLNPDDRTIVSQLTNWIDFGYLFCLNGLPKKATQIDLFQFLSCTTPSCIRLEQIIFPLLRYLQYSHAPEFCPDYRTHEHIFFLKSLLRLIERREPSFLDRKWDVELNANSTSVECNTCTLFMLACQYSDSFAFAMIELYREKIVQTIDHRGSRDETALHCALRESRTRELLDFIVHNSNQSTLNDSTFSILPPIIYALDKKLNGSYENFQFLLAATDVDGSGLNIIDEAIDLAVSERLSKIGTPCVSLTTAFRARQEQIRHYRREFPTILNTALHLFLPIKELIWLTTTFILLQKPSA